MATTTQSSFDSQIDFPRLTYVLRSAQLVALGIEAFILHSDSASLSFAAFFFYSALILITGIHLAIRWYYNLDGSYDFKQLIKETDNGLKATYAVALLSPLVFGFLSWKFVSLTPGLPYSIFRLVSLTQWLMALVLFGLEVYEGTKK